MSGPFVLDCSAAITWIFEDQARRDTDRLLDSLSAGSEAWVPALWHLELANVLAGAHRRRKIDQAGIEAFLSQLKDFEINVDQETMTRAWDKTLDLALQHELSSYDAAYLELALRRNLPLATLDAALIRAAQSTGVRLCLKQP